MVSPLVFVAIGTLIFFPGASCKQCTNGGGASFSSSSGEMQFLDRYDPETLSTVLEERRMALENRGGEAFSSFRRRQHLWTSKFLEEFPLHKVRLDPGSPQGIAQETNLRYLMMLDTDSLLYNFRATAGLKTVGKPLGGWEHPSCELRGHFVGHYLSATAMMWASTGDKALKAKMEELVDGLAKCQDAIKTGYLSAFPTSLFDRFEAIQPVWAPYYTIHKIMAGLLDQYQIGGNDRALGMVRAMADYFRGRVERVVELFTIERQWESLNEEVGGMNDVLYRLYLITGDKGHLWLAHLFDKPCFLGPLAINSDWLGGLHANTHIPLVIGAQQRYEVVGDEIYKDIAFNFYDQVNSSHMYNTGGTSAWEFWQAPKRLGDTLGQNDEESCCTYNLVKVARNLFRWTAEARYADYIERAITNGVMGIQRGTEPGVMIYLLGLGVGNSKARGYHGWGSPLDAFWCCYGTGIESFSKLGDSLYFQKTGPPPSLYVLQFVSSTLHWEQAQLTLEQAVTQPSSLHPFLKSRLTFTKLKLPGGDQRESVRSYGSPIPSSVFVRVPWWARTENSVSVNGRETSVPPPGQFLEIRRAWTEGDYLDISFELSLYAERLADDRPNFASLHAIMFGPYLLAGMTHTTRALDSIPDAHSLARALTPVAEAKRRNTVSFRQGPLTSKPHTECKGGSGAAEDGLETAAALRARLDSRFGVDENGGRRWTDPFPFLEPQLPDKDAWIASQEVTVLSAAAGVVTAGPLPGRGTDEAAEATFVYAPPLSRAPASEDSAGVEWVTPGALVSLELFSRPGEFLAHRGEDAPLGVVKVNGKSTGFDSVSDDSALALGAGRELRATFRLVSGLSGLKDEISLEAEDMPDHFVTIFCGTSVGQLRRTLSLRRRVADSRDFAAASSFSVGQRLADFHPISFVGQGSASHNFLMYPIQAYIDESYTAYFDTKGASPSNREAAM